MAQMIVIYKMPKNPAAFDRHHFEVHVPFARQLPGLRKLETNRGSDHLPLWSQRRRFYI
jgi:uncharacterized protein (TIGR02118 family)